MLFKHYKGALYRVLGECRHSETQELMTVYMSIKDGLLWTRPSEMFHELVDLGDDTVPRFAEVDEDWLRQNSFNNE